MRTTIKPKIEWFGRSKGKEFRICFKNDDQVLGIVREARPGLWFSYKVEYVKRKGDVMVLVDAHKNSKEAKKNLEEYLFEL